MYMQTLKAVDLLAALRQKTIAYNTALEELRTLIEQEGVDIENLRAQRRTRIQFLAVDLARDMSVLAHARIEAAQTPYYQKYLEDFSWYLKDVQGALRIFTAAEGSAYV